MISEDHEVRTRVITAHPRAVMSYLDYSLSHACPFDLSVRDGRTALVSVYNLHAGIEVGVMLSGEEERVFPDVTLPVCDGDVWLVAPWEVHGNRCFGAVARVLRLVFLPEFLGEPTLGDLPWLTLFAVPPRQRPRASGDRMRARIISIAEELWSENEERAPGWEEAVRANLLRLLIVLRRAWQPPRVPLLLPDRGNGLQRLVPVLTASYVEPAAHLSVDDAAASCGLSRRQFTQVFRQTMGISFLQFRLRVRVEAASQQLLSTDLGLEAIAQQTGFTDASHLHHTFTKQYGCTPAEYRRRFHGSKRSAEEARASRP